ncbi:MAG: hypothetical protein ACJ754_02510 [Pyrinomonadaceae bacterium]
MSKFGKTLFGGSRFIFRALAPVLLFCAVVLPFLVAEWTAWGVLFVSLVEALLLCFMLGLYDPQRFRWATRCVTAVVFCAYLAYAVESVFLGGEGAGGAGGGRSGTSPQNAVAGFIAIGLPCLWYTIRGRFTLSDRGHNPESGPELSDKVDAIDI